MTKEEYIQMRVDDQINWYSGKSFAAKKKCLTLQIMELVLSLSIPFVSNFLTPESIQLKHIINIFGLLIAAIAGILILMKYKENWIEYRTTSELLINEKMLFLTMTGPYAGEGGFQLFVETVEGILSKEHAKWRTNINQNNEEEKKEIEPK